MQNVAAVPAKMRAHLMCVCREFKPKYLCPFLKPRHAALVLAATDCSETEAHPSLGAFPVLLSMLPCLFEVCLTPSSIRGTCINMLSSHVFCVLPTVFSSRRSSSTRSPLPILLMKTVVCSNNTWVACLYRMSYSLFHPNLSLLLLSAFQTGHLMWAGGGGGEVYSGVCERW